MKPHLSLVILAAMLATAPAKEGYYAYVETEAGAPAFIRDTVTCEEYTGTYKSKEDRNTETCCSFAGQADFYNYALLRQGLFSKDDSSLKLEETALRAYNGSIILDNLTIINSDMTTKSDGETDVFWGLPQIALSNVKFLKDNPLSDPSSFTSNYSTFTAWDATDCTIQITQGGATFTSGTVNGAVVIDAVAEGAAAIHLTANPGKGNLGDGTLTINAKDKITIGETPGIGEDILVIQGNLALNYTGEGSGEGWDVDVLSQVNGSLKVNAAAGRVNAGILNGSGEIAAQQVYLTSFTGSTLAVQGSDSVALKGNATATGADLAVSLAGGSISIDGSVTAANGGAFLKSTAGDIEIGGTLGTKNRSTLESARDIIIGGQLNGSLSATAAGSIILHAGANLAESSLQGNVVSTTGADITLEHSTVTGTVDSARTLVLSDAAIGRAENISTLASSGASQIKEQGGELKVDTLILSGGSLTLGTPESHNERVILNRLTVEASTVLNANLLLNKGGCVTFATDAVVTFNGYGTITLMGDVDFILLDGQGVPPAYSRLMMDCVQDVLDADGRSVTSIWKQYSDRDVWYTELYELGDPNGVHYTTNSNAAGATLSQLSLIYDAAMAQNNNATYGRLLIGNIPEPATGTLSLLALCALAARRRRK